MEEMNKYPASDADRIAGMQERSVLPSRDFPEGKPTREAVAANMAKRLDDFIGAAKDKGISETEALARYDILYFNNLYSLSGGAEKFAALRDKWVQAVDDPNVLSAEKINAWPQIRQEALGDIQYWSHVPETVGKLRDAWVKAGVVTAQEVNALIKKEVIDRLNNDRVHGEMSKELESRDKDYVERLKKLIGSDELPDLLAKYEIQKKKYIDLGVITEQDLIRDS